MNITGHPPTVRIRDRLALLDAIAEARRLFDRTIDLELERELRALRKERAA
jgi:hypothetical protein